MAGRRLNEASPISLCSIVQPWLSIVEGCLTEFGAHSIVTSVKGA